MKYCIHVTLSGSVEVEAKSVKEAIKLAAGSVDLVGADQFDSQVKLFESYPKKKNNSRIGIGSH